LLFWLSFRSAAEESAFAVAVVVAVAVPAEQQALACGNRQSKERALALAFLRSPAQTSPLQPLFSTTYQQNPIFNNDPQPIPKKGIDPDACTRYGSSCKYLGP
jgi:hypothetical protein